MTWDADNGELGDVSSRNTMGEGRKAVRQWLLAQAEEQDSSLTSCLKQVENWTKTQRSWEEGRSSQAQGSAGKPPQIEGGEAKAARI